MVCQMSRQDIHSAEENGYRPEGPIDFGPLFQWPPRPAALFKWLLGFPGYLMPLRLFFVGMATATWLCLMPDLSRVRSMSIDWIAVLGFRNLLLFLVLISAWNIPLYVYRVQGAQYKYDRKWLEVDS